jgi:3-deoxy-D-manno-octulosonic-acid transferase
MRLLYLLGIKGYTLGIHLAALFHPKARLWVDGRKSWRKKLKASITPGAWIWFHAASLGEHESLKPIMEALHRQVPRHKLLLTFFSPSGYEVRKQDPLADVVCYLPMDSPANARDFVSIVNPRLVIFARYEFWLYYMQVLQQQQIPHVITAATFREGQFVMGPLGGFIRRYMKQLACVFVQNDASLKLLRRHGFQNADFSGDTRVDRVWNIAQTPVDYPEIKAFCEGAQVLIAGSSWAPDEAHFLPAWRKASHCKLIIAPHLVDPGNLRRLEKSLGVPALRWSQANVDNVGGYSVLIVDNIGHLSKLYRFGFMAFVGGGYTTGIHNILEAAAYGLPVCFGPNHRAFPEAEALMRAGSGFCIESPGDFEKVFMQLLKDDQALQKARNASFHYVQSQQGATQKIVDFVLPLLRGTDT